MFKVNNLKTPDRSHVVIVNFEHISHLFLVFLLLILNTYMLARNFLSHVMSMLHFIPNDY